MHPTPCVPARTRVSAGAKPKKVILLANGLPVEKFSDGTIAPPPCIAVPETLELLLDAATTKLDLHHGARHIFDEARPARTVPPARDFTAPGVASASPMSPERSARHCETLPRFLPPLCSKVPRARFRC